MDEMQPFIHLAILSQSLFLPIDLVQGFFQVKFDDYTFMFRSLHSSISSFSMRDASRICHPSTKVVCYPIIVNGRTLLRCSDITLAMILYSRVVRHMESKLARMRASMFFETQ